MKGPSWDKLTSIERRLPRRIAYGGPNPLLLSASGSRTTVIS
jgi:hypothetical protein